MKWLWQGVIFVFGFISGNLSTFFEVFRYYESRPSVLIGYLQEPSADVHVLLDNGAQSQFADENNGFFRFENMIRGTHNLRFESKTYHAFSLPVGIDGPGENELPDKISLIPVHETRGHRSGSKVLAVALNYSVDGSEPLEDANKRFVYEDTYAQANDLERELWVYLGKRTQSGAFSDLRFDVRSNSPSLVGMTGFAKDTTVVRATAPTKARGVDGFYLGDTVGHIDQGQQVVVKRISDPIGDNNVWAKVSIVR
jgi:hypothetical protein